MKNVYISVLLLTGLILFIPEGFADGIMRGDGPAPEPKPFHINKADQALDDVVAPNAKLELMADGFGLNEGPVWVRNGKSGHLLVSSR
jgi:hypothetical protein